MSAGMPWGEISTILTVVATFLFLLGVFASGVWKLSQMRFELEAVNQALAEMRERLRELERGAQDRNRD